MGKTRILIVDDHTLVRDGIRALLALVADVEVVGEASNGKEALDKVRRLAPQVVLMDLAMPIMGGVEATRRIRKESPETKVLALTQYDDREYVTIQPRRHRDSKVLLVENVQNVETVYDYNDLNEQSDTTA